MHIDFVCIKYILVCVCVCRIANLKVKNENEINWLVLWKMFS